MMKVITAVAITLVLFVAASADEDKKAKVLSFYKCLACSEDSAARDEYKKCKELKPEKCKKITEKCVVKFIPDATTSESRWEAVCKDDTINEQIYDCILNHENRKDMDDAEKTQLKEFVQCAKKVGEKFCDH